MNLSHHLRSVWSLLLVGVAVGCSDSTPIGSIQCLGEKIRCGFTEQQQQSASLAQIQPPRDTVSSTDSPVLNPAFTRHAFEDAPEFGLHLFAEPDGVLWTVRGGGPRLILERLDDEGAKLEEIAIAPPKGTPKPQRFSPISIAVNSGSARSMTVLTVTWSRGCDGSAGSEDCQIAEALVFDDLAAPPRRTPVGAWNPPSIQANESGIWVFYGDRIDKYDGRGKLAWRQTALLTLERPDVSWNAFGGVQANNELSVLLTSYTTSSTNTGLELWRVDAFGNIDERQQVAWGGEMPQYAVDPRGRSVIVGTIFDGDLAIMRVALDLAVEGNVIQRDEYLDLRPDSFTLDSNGGVYVTMPAGGREPSDMREMLCQLPVSGEVRCFTLGEISASKSSFELIDDVVVPEPGVVYVRSGANLRRYELPPL